MDEILDVLDLLADSGLEGAIIWVFRILGLLAILAGIGVWLFTNITLVVPVVLIIVGLVLIVVPGVLLQIAELAG
ncbi:fatty acid desaturase [Halarchaeum rubridurum]|uniref:Fatty acid desaturase n=2 Tax=Halarchaeum TaxID=744724 RepID=A0A830G540_9EURY|nr:hypothetical protein [Halarchaeum rubridurum]MBP1955854.1 fatty acid desaturase [Halarchaeum rubridurum]GGM76935.1 hypothetical protein GCM10009017_28350 [Halarchaeum rubridurum]